MVALTEMPEPRFAAAIRYGLAAGSVLLSLAALKPAHAQQLDQFISPQVPGVGNERGVTVSSRQRPEYQDRGVRLGSFSLHPSLVESVGYESNVLGTARPSGSGVVDTVAGVQANSDMSWLDLNGAVEVNDVRYLDLPRQSYTNWSARLNGAHQLGRDLVSVRFEHLDLTQTPRDLDVPQALDRPLSWRRTSISGSYRANFNRLSVTPSIQVARYTYDSGTAGGNVYPQGFRNRAVLSPALTLGYDFSPGRSAVVVVREAVAFYSQSLPGLPKRNYQDTAILAGFDYDITGLLRARALFGYEVRSFAASVYRNIHAPVAELSLIWNPSGMTTVTAAVARRIADAAEEVSAGVTETSARLRVDHEYRRNLLLSANAGVAFNSYGSGGNQVLYSAGAGITYLANRYLRLAGTYEFLARQNGGKAQLNAAGLPIGSDYVDHRLLFQARLAL